jgi:hypothetical protein
MGIICVRFGNRPCRPAMTRSWSRRFGRTTRYLAVLGIAFLAAAAGARADIHDGLVLHLSFDGDVSDHTGRGNDGTIARPGADSPFVPGIIGMAFQTTGSVPSPEFPTGNYITLGNPDDLNFGTSTDFSFSWWGQYTAEAQHDDIPWLCNKDWNGPASRGYVLASEPGGRFMWNYRGRGDVRQDSPIVGGGLNDGQWHHYVVTFSRGIGGTGSIYLDGTVVNTSPLDGTGDINFVFPLNIFQDGTGNYTDVGNGANFDLAAIDDLGIWRRAITANEVNMIYTMGLLGQSALDPSP